MKRLDCWITEIQANNIKEYKKIHEGYNKTRIVREALDEFFIKRQNKENKNVK